MNALLQALTFSQWALEAMLLPPLLLVLTLAAASLFWRGLRQRPFLAALWKPYYWLVLTQLLFFVAAIAAGVLRGVPLDGPISSRHPDRAGELFLDAVSCGSFASCAFWIWRMKGLHLFAASLVVLLEVPVLGALFVAGMSVSGDWL